MFNIVSYNVNSTRFYHYCVIDDLELLFQLMTRSTCMRVRHCSLRWCWLLSLRSWYHSDIGYSLGALVNCNRNTMSCWGWANAIVDDRSSLIAEEIAVIPRRGWLHRAADSNMGQSDMSSSAHWHVIDFDMNDGSLRTKGKFLHRRSHASTDDKMSEPVYLAKTTEGGW